MFGLRRQKFRCRQDAAAKAGGRGARGAGIVHGACERRANRRTMSLPLRPRHMRWTCTSKLKQCHESGASDSPLEVTLRVPAGQPAAGPLSTKSAPLVRRRRGTLRAAAWITDPSRSSIASAAAPDTTRRECARRRAGSGLRHSIMPSRASLLALVLRVGFAWLPSGAAYPCVHARARARLRCEGHNTGHNNQERRAFLLSRVRTRFAVWGRHGPSDVFAVPVRAPLTTQIVCPALLQCRRTSLFVFGGLGEQGADTSLRVQRCW